MRLFVSLLLLQAFIECLLFAGHKLSIRDAKSNDADPRGEADWREEILGEENFMSGPEECWEEGVLLSIRGS